MKRSRLSMLFILASIAIIIISFFVPSQLNPGINYVYLAALVNTFMSMIACFYASIERSSTTRKALSARSLCGFNVFLTSIFLLGIFNPVGVNAFNMEGGPIPINQNETFIILWIISYIPLIIAALIYEDQILKRFI